MEKSIPINPGEDNIYVNADKDHDIKGSIPTAAFFNQVEQELLNLITAAGITPSAADMTQLKQAVATMILNESSKVRYQSLYQNINSVTGGVVEVIDEKIIGFAEVSADTTFVFNTEKVSKTAQDDIITFELYINMPTPVVVVWPGHNQEIPPTEEGGAATTEWVSDVDWGDDGEPDLSESGLYLFAFRSLDNGTSWEGAFQKKFAVISAGV